MIDNMVFEVGVDPCPTISWGAPISEDEMFSNIEKLMGYVEACGYSVEFKHGCYTRCSHQDRTIYINSALGLRKKFYILLHESAHMIMHLKSVQEDGNEFPYIMLYPGLANKRMAATKVESMRHMVALVHEELDAWRKGIDLAHVLQLELDMYDYTQLAYKSAGTYIKAASEFCKDRV